MNNRRRASRVADFSAKHINAMLSMTRRMRKKILEFVAKRGTLIEPEAADYLLGLPDPLKELASVMNEFGEPPLILTLRDIMAAEKIALDAASRAVVREKRDPTIRPET